MTNTNTCTCTPLSEVSSRDKAEAVALLKQKLLTIYRSIHFSIFLLYDNIVEIYFIIYQEVLGQFSKLNMQNNPKTPVQVLMVSNLHIT
jgi:hypothetical protein